MCEALADLTPISSSPQREKYNINCLICNITVCLGRMDYVGDTKCALKVNTAEHKSAICKDSMDSAS